MVFCDTPDINPFDHTDSPDQSHILSAQLNELINEDKPLKLLIHFVKVHSEDDGHSGGTVVTHRMCSHFQHG